jgi:hypothetical protein
MRIVLAMVLLVPLAASADTVLVPGGSSVTLQCDPVPPVCAEPEPEPEPEPVPPPPPPPPPSGGGLLFSEGFESGNLAAWNLTAQQARPSQERAHSGSWALKVDQPSYGWGGELQKELGDRGRAWLSYWWFIPTGFNSEDHTGRHFWRWGGSNGKQVDNETDGGGSDFIRLQTVSFWTNGEHNHWGAAQIPTGRWVRVGYWFAPADGVRSIYVDGVRVFHETGISFGSDVIQRLRMVTNFDSCSGICHWFYDDIEVRDSLPAVP